MVWTLVIHHGGRLYHVPAQAHDTQGVAAQVDRPSFVPCPCVPTCTCTTPVVTPGSGIPLFHWHVYVYGYGGGGGRNAG